MEYTKQEKEASNSGFISGLIVAGCISLLLGKCTNISIPSELERIASTDSTRSIFLGEKFGKDAIYISAESGKSVLLNDYLNTHFSDYYDRSIEKTKIMRDIHGSKGE